MPPPSQVCMANAPNTNANTSVILHNSSVCDAILPQTPSECQQWLSLEVPQGCNGRFMQGYGKVPASAHSAYIGISVFCADARPQTAARFSASTSCVFTLPFPNRKRLSLVRDMRWYRAVPLLDFLILAVLAICGPFCRRFPRRQMHHTTFRRKKNEPNMNSFWGRRPAKGRQGCRNQGWRQGQCHESTEKSGF
jgi:hypothetical protein